MREKRLKFNPPHTRTGTKEEHKRVKGSVQLALGFGEFIRFRYLVKTVMNSIDLFFS